MEEGLAEADMSVSSSAMRMPAPMFIPMRARGKRVSVALQRRAGERSLPSPAVQL